ncbi:MAG: hypothetical protein RL720_455 [Actinomycetota bacterium]
MGVRVSSGAPHVEPWCMPLRCYYQGVKTFLNPVKTLSLLLVVSSAALLAGCTTAPVEGKRAVVIVSGGDAVSPFTTTTEACTSGLSAGNTDTGLREKLIADGFEVFTAPAMNARTEVVEPAADSFGAFGDCPDPLPAYMTIVSNADVDNAGEHLAHFANYLNETYGVTEIDWVGHSNGGLYARSATRILQQMSSPVQGVSLTTVGTPWMGSFPFQVVYGEEPATDCMGDPRCEGIIAGITEELSNDQLLAREQLYKYILGDKGWNQAQIGVLDNIPVFMLGGAYLTNDAGDPRFWPFDGLVSAYSATAQGLPETTAPQRQCKVYPLTHSIFISNLLELDWQTALTWNAEALNDVSAFITSAREGKMPQGDGCVTP